MLEQLEFIKRRKQLMAQMQPNSIALLPAAVPRVRSRDVEYPYRQDSDFYYLTGFPEPEAVAVLIPGRSQGQYLLFCRERNPELEIWHGRHAGTEDACNHYKADDAFPITDLDDILPGLLEGKNLVYYAMGCQPEFDQRVMQWFNSVKRKSRTGAHPPAEFVALDHLLHEMRLYKSAAELKAMRQAAQISAQAHRTAMQLCQPGMHEYELEAIYLQKFCAGGCQSWAYPPIVAAGSNACTLHYTTNRDLLQKGDLVLVDAGGEYDYYAADITRTFPINGHFNQEQAVLYNLVLQAQLAAIEQIKPGKHWNHPHEAAVQVLTEGLVELGLLKGKVSQLIKKEAYKAFYMHRTGHWLGMDVHDVGDYKIEGTWRLLEPGMVLTVEPGLYIAPDNKTVAKKWRGIGIRIEDDVVVTQRGCEVLTDAAPKTINQIEASMAKQSSSRK